MSLDRFLVTYIAQVLLALIIWFLFNHYYREHKRPFLRLWALSWLFYAVVYTSSILIIATPGVYAQVGSALTIIFTYLQLLFLVLGVIAITINKSLHAIYLTPWILVVFVFGLITFILFREDAEGSNWRYFLRVGLKSLITGMVFLWVAIKVFSNPKFHKGLGRNLLFFAFLLYAIQQLWHSGIVIGNVSGYHISFPMATYGIIDLFSLSLIGFGMMVWLLENEQMLLKKANRELDSFLYSTSHDLRAPVASILGLTNLARHDAKEEASKKYFGMIEDRIKKLDQTIGDILLLSKSANLDVVLSTFNFETFLQQIIERLDFQKGLNQIEINTELAFDYVTSDEEQLRIIITNLLTNAIKYHDLNKESPYVLIRLRQEGAYYLITMKDNGQGISTSALPKIFEMFYRASNDSDGTGLGLYIVKESVHRLDGEIFVESNEGEGTIIIIKLPITSKGLAD